MNHGERDHESQEIQEMMNDQETSMFKEQREESLRENDISYEEIVPKAHDIIILQECMENKLQETLIVFFTLKFP